MDKIPAFGTVIVVDGVVHQAHEHDVVWTTCWCSNDQHAIQHRSAGARPNKPAQPHLIGVRVLEQVWRVP